MIMDRYGGPHTAITTALHRGLYLANNLYRYGGSPTILTIVLHRSLYLAFIMDLYRGPHPALTIALHRFVYLPIKWAVIEIPKLPLQYPCMEASTHPL
jgi:hypothetical protein